MGEEKKSRDLNTFPPPFMALQSPHVRLWDKRTGVCLACNSSELEKEGSGQAHRRPNLWTTVEGTPGGLTGEEKVATSGGRLKVGAILDGASPR